MSCIEASGGKQDPETNEPVPRQPSNTASLFRVLWLAGGSLVYGRLFSFLFWVPLMLSQNNKLKEPGKGEL